MDYMISGIIENEQVRIYAIDGTELSNEFQSIHNTTPLVTAAVGRALNAVSMMTMMLKNDKDRISAQIKCDGPIENILVVGDKQGNIKADVYNPQVSLLLKENGKLDVAAAIGSGTLTIIKDLGLKQPYIGTVEIISGEIAEDFTYYFATSEQTPSVVGLGVLVNPDGSVKKSGGFIIQLMPQYSEDIVTYLENKLEKLPSITDLMELGKTPEDIINDIFKKYTVNFTDKKQITYNCDCNVERFERGIMSLGKDEISTLINEDEGAEIQCHFCNKKYNFSKKSLENILDKLQ